MRMARDKPAIAEAESRTERASKHLAERIEGFRLRSLMPHNDERGVLTEIFREEWETGISPVQWNCVRSAKNVLRGVHVHVKHTDYLMLAYGRASIGLRDLRPGSPTEGVTTLLPLSGDQPGALTIPPGVAHGFFFHEPSMHIYAVSAYWEPADELGCHWADPDLGIPWPVPSALVSPRDAALPPLSHLIGLIAPWSTAHSG